MEEGYSSSHPATDDPIAYLVIFGHQSIDDDSYQTGQMLERLPNWCQVTKASTVVVDDDSGVVTVARDVDGGTE
ncbi:hypothetical protein V1520DRAFT_357509 [Lipomyces starkeyi]